MRGFFQTVGLLTLVGLVFSLPLGNDLVASDKVALVIGNSAYSNQALANPVNDADLMKEVLEELGFKVLIAKNANLPEMENALREFKAAIPKKGLGFFFYAGHGIQVKGENYLLPVGYDTLEEHEVPYKTMNVGMVLDAMDSSPSNLNVLVLDCCRNNPFQRSWTRSQTTGLAPISNVPQGTMLAFSTASGVVAADGRDGNSPYVKELAKQLRNRPEQGLELLSSFRLASQQVFRNSYQRPWIHFDASMDTYYLWAPTVTNTPESMASDSSSSTIKPLIFSDILPLESSEPTPEAVSEPKPSVFSDPEEIERLKGRWLNNQLDFSNAPDEIVFTDTTIEIEGMGTAGYHVLSGTTIKRLQIELDPPVTAVYGFRGDSLMLSLPRDNETLQLVLERESKRDAVNTYDTDISDQAAIQHVPIDSMSAWVDTSIHHWAGRESELMVDSIILSLIIGTVMFLFFGLLARFLLRAMYPRQQSNSKGPIAGQQTVRGDALVSSITPEEIVPSWSESDNTH